MHLLLKLEILV